MTDPNQSAAIFIHYMWQGAIMLIYLLVTTMCMQIAHVQHMHSLRLTPQCSAFL